MTPTSTSACPKRCAALSLLVLGGVAVLSPAPARAQVPPPTVVQLQQEIRKRDALIENLLHRVEALERQEAGTRPAPRPAAATARQAPRPASRAVTASTGSTSAGSTSTGSAQAAEAPPVPPATAAAAAPAPGQFKVDAQAAERALERTLTASGALLVPYGSAEVEPAFSYVRREIPNLVLFTNNRNEFTGSFGLRVGLPWESQLSLGIPYIGVTQQTIDNFVSPPQQVASGSGAAFGDLTLGLSKTLLHQRGWLPDLIGAISYEAPTGPLSVNRIALPGSGQNRLGFSLTALKRQDPLAFVASVGYSKAFEQSHFNPGDQFSVLGGVYLATSPETSLSASLLQVFGQAPTLDGVNVTGGNTVQTTLLLGASSILGRGTLLNLQLGIGLTRDAPKYSVILSFPIRFALR